MVFVWRNAISKRKPHKISDDICSSVPMVVMLIWLGEAFLVTRRLAAAREVQLLSVSDRKSSWLEDSPLNVPQIKHGEGGLGS